MGSEFSQQNSLISCKIVYQFAILPLPIWLEGFFPLAHSARSPFLWAGKLVSSSSTRLVYSLGNTVVLLCSLKSDWSHFSFSLLFLGHIFHPHWPTFELLKCNFLGAVTSHSQGARSLCSDIHHHSGAPEQDCPANMEPKACILEFSSGLYLSSSSLE